MKKLIIIAGLLLATNGHAQDKLFPARPSPHDPHSADSKENIQPYKAISKTTPIYPKRAQSSGMEGSVVLEYTINTEGNVVDIRVMGTTDETFNKTAIRAAEKFVYEPSINLDTGLPIDTPGVRGAFTFVLEGYEETLTLGGFKLYVNPGSLSNKWNSKINTIQKMKPKDAIRRIENYLADEEEDLKRASLYYLRSLRAAEIEPRNLSAEKEDLQNAYILLNDQVTTDPNVIKLKSYVIPALGFMEMDADNKKALALLEEFLWIVNYYHLAPSIKVYYSYSNFGVLTYNSGNWCQAYESFDAAINTAKKIGVEETPNLKKFRDLAKERL